MIRLFVEKKMLLIQSKDGVVEFQLSLCGIFILLEVLNHSFGRAVDRQRSSIPPRSQQPLLRGLLRKQRRRRDS